MDDLRAVSFHFFSGLFNVTTRASITGRIADQFNFHVRVDAECAFYLAHGAQTFSTRAALVAVADDDADLCGGFHKYTFLVSFIMICFSLPPGNLITLKIMGQWL